MLRGLTRELEQAVDVVTRHLRPNGHDGNGPRDLPATASQSSGGGAGESKYTSFAGAENIRLGIFGCFRYFWVFSVFLGVFGIFGCFRYFWYFSAR